MFSATKLAQIVIKPHILYTLCIVFLDFLDIKQEIHLYSFQNDTEKPPRKIRAASFLFPPAPEASAEKWSVADARGGGDGGQGCRYRGNDDLEDEFPDVIFLHSG